MPNREKDVPWATQHLCASAGFAVEIRHAVVRVPTIVPQRRPEPEPFPKFSSLEEAREFSLNRRPPACHWLDDSGRCQVHANAPYGCAMFDEHMDDDDFVARRARGINAILADYLANGFYRWLWAELYFRGLIAIDPAIAKEMRERFREKNRKDDYQKTG